MTEKERTLKELERLKESISKETYEIAVAWVKFGPNNYRSGYDVVEAVERAQEPCPF